MEATQGNGSLDIFLSFGVLVLQLLSFTFTQSHCFCFVHISSSYSIKMYNLGSYGISFPKDSVHIWNSALTNRLLSRGDSAFAFLQSNAAFLVMNNVSLLCLRAYNPLQEVSTLTRKVTLVPQVYFIFTPKLGVSFPLFLLLMSKSNKLLSLEMWFPIQRADHSTIESTVL